VVWRGGGVWFRGVMWRGGTVRCGYVLFRAVAVEYSTVLSRFVLFRVVVVRYGPVRWCEVAVEFCGVGCRGGSVRYGWV
jgi:hypothetical protein